MLLIIVISFVGAIKWQQEAINEAEMRLLDMQVNYAVDAAVQEMLEQADNLNTDYADWGSMQLDPEVARKTYVQVLLRNLGWSETKENIEALEQNCIPFFCVAVYDGYYMWAHQDTWTEVNGIKNTTRDLMWSPKLPYASQKYTDGMSRSEATLYYYNIGNRTYGTYRNGRLKVDNTLRLSGTGEGSLMSARKAIADSVSNSCTYALLYATEGKSNQAVDIPFIKSSWIDSNPITTPTVLTVINSPDGVFTKFNHFVYGVGGAKVDEAEFCICYLKNGKKFYTYAYNRPKIEAMGISILEIVTSPKAACDRGYYFDLSN